MIAPAARTFDGIRSLLFVPAGNEKLLRSAMKRRCDVIILDLEDAIPPDEKGAARAGLVHDIALLREGDAHVCVRVNRPWTMMVGDIAATMKGGADMIMLPKIERACDVMVAAEIIDELAPDRTPVMITPVMISQIESARGLVSMAEIAATRPDRHAALMLGPEDLALDLGTAASREVMGFHAQALLTAAKSGGLAAIGSPGSIAETGDMDAYRAQLMAARTMGFDAVAAIHPVQLAVIDNVFQPQPAEIAQAHRIVEGDRQSGGRPFLLEGRMVDAPVVSRARALLASVNDNA